MLERLLLKNSVDCTSQHLKWTSGARVMNIFGRGHYGSNFPDPHTETLIWLDLSIRSML